MSFLPRTLQLAENVVKVMTTQAKKLVTVESCTGGLIAAVITQIPGASKIFDYGLVTYSNQVKSDLVKVRPETLEEYGAVSPQTAREMVKGGLVLSNADFGVSVTGIAGPGGGSKNKPVGLVYIASGDHDKVIVEKNRFTGTREEIREATVNKALEMIMEGIGS